MSASTPLPAWTPFAAASLKPQDHLKAAAIGIDQELIFLNSRYQVNIRPFTHSVFGQVAHLSIKSLDKEARHDWRDFQRIKNELCGEECEAIEIYPAESRLIDTANQYHLWVFHSYKIDLGWQQRLVCGESSETQHTKQRPFEAGQLPPDAISADEMDAMIDALIEAKDAKR